MEGSEQRPDRDGPAGPGGAPGARRDGRPAGRDRTRRDLGVLRNGEIEARHVFDERGHVFDHAAVESVADTDFDLIQRIQHVEFCECHGSEPVNLGCIAGRERVKPTTAARSTGASALLRSSTSGAQRLEQRQAQVGAITFNPYNLKLELHQKTSREVFIDIQEVHKPELDAQLVALDQASGDVVWKEKIDDYAAGYSATAAPITNDQSP